MTNDPRKLKPIELCRLLNSTPLGEVLKESRLRKHRSQAGHRIGTNRHVDLVRYAGWLVERRHGTPKATSPGSTGVDRAESAESTRAVVEACAAEDPAGTKLTPKQQRCLAALLTEPTHKSAALKAGVSPNTLCRWLKLPQFRRAYEATAHDLRDVMQKRVLADSGDVYQSLLHIALQGRTESARLRACQAILDFGTVAAATLGSPGLDVAALRPHDLVQSLSNVYRQIKDHPLDASEKTRNLTAIGQAIMQAHHQGELQTRLEALEDVLNRRKPPRRSS